MKFMVLVKATADSEAGKPPSEKLLAEMGRFNSELVQAGVLLAGEGLHPSSRGMRIQFSANGQKRVVDGPFSAVGELVAGFWILQCKSREEAIEWSKRCPHPHPGQEAVIEIRQVLSPEELGSAP
jgi:hypothetical protein